MEMDSRTVLAVLTMKSLNPKLYVAAELYDSKFQNHLEMAHCDEIILTSEYEHSLLATASSGMGYSNVIRELIGDDADSGILIEDIPSSYIGKTYGEFRSFFATGSVLIGLLQNTGNFYLRRQDALREAQKNPDVKKIIGNLKKIKTLKSNDPLLVPADDFVIQPNTKAIFVKGKKNKEEALEA
jgi:voltage-gated potassium channel